MWIRLARSLRRARFERELDEELRDHMAKYAGDLVASGVPPEEALWRSRREFGGVVRIKEDVRDAGRLGRVEAAVRHIRFAARVLRKNPVFAVTVIVTLALAIGANTAVFSVVNAMFVRPLPYPEPNRLGSIYTHVREPQGAEYDQTAVLIGCVNIAGLTLGRTVTRRREMATRLALGSGRSGIVAHMLSESVLLATTGGLFGLMLGYVAIRLLQPMIIETLQPAQPITIDLTVLMVTAAVTLLTAVMFGLLFESIR